MKKIAFITSSEQPEISSDDKLLAEALELEGVVSIAAPWDDEKINWGEFDLILIRSCWNYFRKIDEFMRWLNGLKLKNYPVCNSVETVIWNINKDYLKELSSHGILVPDSIWLLELPHQYEELRNILMEKKWEKAIIKPCISAGSFQTLTTSLASIKEDFLGIKNFEFKGGIILQEFSQEVVDEGEVSLLYFNNKFSHAVKKRPKAGEFRVQSQFGGTVEKYFPGSSLLTQVQPILDYIKDHQVLYARIDGFLKRGKFILMELELIEPNLFLGYNKSAAGVLAGNILKKIEPNC